MQFLDERITRTPGHKLRELLKSGQLILGGGAHDALTARLVEETGYPLCVVTGAGVSMCRGYPDVGFVTLEEMVANARYIAEAVRIPVIVDADNGYGNALNVMRTVREFERAGVAGIHIEDQDWPKRCGHMFGKRLIPMEEMVQKIRAALDARRDEDFVIIARCDALMVEGLEKTLERGEAYAEAGADMLFSRCASHLTRSRPWPIAFGVGSHCTSTTPRAAWCHGCMWMRFMPWALVPHVSMFMRSWLLARP